MLGGSVTVSGEGHFLSENPMSDGGFSDGLFASNVTQVAVISGWKLEWLLWVHGPHGTCQRSRFDDGAHARCSMGPNQSLERVFFSLKSPLKGVQRHILGLQCHASDCDFSLE